MRACCHYARYLRCCTPIAAAAVAVAVLVVALTCAGNVVAGYGGVGSVVVGIGDDAVADDGGNVDCDALDLIVVAAAVDSYCHYCWQWSYKRLYSRRLCCCYGSQFRYVLKCLAPAVSPRAFYSYIALCRQVVS